MVPLWVGALGHGPTKQLASMACAAPLHIALQLCGKACFLEAYDNFECLCSSVITCDAVDWKASQQPDHGACKDDAEEEFCYSYTWLSISVSSGTCAKEGVK